MLLNAKMRCKGSPDEYLMVEVVKEVKNGVLSSASSSQMLIFFSRISTPAAAYRIVLSIMVNSVFGVAITHADLPCANLLI